MVGLGETWTRREASGAWGRTVAPRERGNPALLASSEQLVLTDNDSKAGRQSTFPFISLPFSSRAGAHGEPAVQPSGVLPTCTFPVFGYLHNRPPRGPNNCGPCHRNLGDKYLPVTVCRVWHSFGFSAETQGDLLFALTGVAALPFALVAQDQTSLGISAELYL